MSVLVHAADPALRDAIADAVRRAGHASEMLDAASLAQRLAGGDVYAVVLDLAASGAASALRAMCEATPEIAVVAMVPDASVTGCVEAWRSGARHVLRKPFDPAALERALAACAPRPRSGWQEAARPLGADPAFCALLSRIGALGPTDVSVALSGESGSGKTRLAQWLHARSLRRAAACVEIAGGELDCDRAEPDPGGHARALSHLRARLEVARGGTLVLDEPGEIPPALQARLLRLLEPRAGALVPIADVRVVTTSRATVEEQVARGLLLPDLGVRLAAVALEVPPLRERRGDLATLARHFAEAAVAANGGPPPRLDEAALCALAELPFPGNLRELESLMRRAALLFPGRTVHARSLARPLGAIPEPAPLELQTLDLAALERAAIERALAIASGNRTVAAGALGISARTLRSKLRSGSAR